MHSPLASRTLLLVPDSRQTALAAFAVAGLDQAAYSAYGHQSRAPAFRTGFNGQLREAPGWYLLGNGHRVYNPVLMRFHSADHFSPFGEGGMNPYAYCVGDPINHSDPTGRFFEWLGANPLHSLGLNTALLAANLVASILVPPAGVALLSARMSSSGALAGMVGAGAQLVGVEDGRGISIIATMVSFGGAAVRIGIGVNSLLQEKGQIGKKIYEGMRNLLVGPRKKAAQVSARASIASQAPATPSAPPPAVTQSVAPLSRAPSIPGSVSSRASTATTIRPGLLDAPSISSSVITPGARHSMSVSSVFSQASSSRSVRQPVEPFNVKQWLEKQT